MMNIFNISIEFIQIRINIINNNIDIVKFYATILTN
jgi:hypothetical protein